MNEVIHFQNAFGLGQRTWTRMTLYDSWADLDGHPVQRHLERNAFSVRECATDSECSVLN